MAWGPPLLQRGDTATQAAHQVLHHHSKEPVKRCLLYTSDAADERSSVDLGGRRIIKKKTYIPESVNSAGPTHNNTLT